MPLSQSESARTQRPGQPCRLPGSWQTTYVGEPCRVSGRVERPVARRFHPAPYGARLAKMTPARGCILADDRAALTQQIKEANDIVDVVGGYVSLRPAGPTFKGLCPFHDDKRPSFDVDPRRQRYKCWSCGKSGDVFN